MADTTTTYLGLTIPEEFGSDDTWGGKLIAAWVALDALFADTEANGGHEHSGAAGDGPKLPPGSLFGFSGPGIPAYVDDDQFAARAIAAGAGIAVEDGDGQAGDPTISVDISTATALGEAPAADDVVLVHDISADAPRKVTIPELLTSAKPATSTAGAIPRFTNTTGSLGEPASGPTMDANGNVDLGANTVARGQFKGTGGTVVNHGSTAGGVQLDLSAANVHTLTWNGAGPSLTLTLNLPTSVGGAQGFVLLLTNGGGFTTITWPTGTVWPGGIAPTLTTTGVDMIVFLTPNAGSTWYATLVGTDYQ